MTISRLMQWDGLRTSYLSCSLQRYWSAMNGSRKILHDTFGQLTNQMDELKFEEEAFDCSQGMHHVTQRRDSLLPNDKLAVNACRSKVTPLLTWRL
jgi:hypothetical protein